MEFKKDSEYEEHEELSRKLEEELEKINLTSEEIREIANWKGRLPNKKGIFLFNNDRLKYPEEGAIAYILEVALSKRGFNFDGYKPHQIDFYTKCRAEDLANKEDFDPKKLIAQFKKYYRLAQLKE